MYEVIIEFLKTLDNIQIWFLLVFICFIIFQVFLFAKYLINRYGLPYNDKILFDPNKTDSKLPKYLKALSWEKDVFVTKPSLLNKNKKIKIGTIGFVKDLVVFKFFGEYWNSASKVGQEGYNLFETEFTPPDFLEEAHRKEMECFVFVENCNLQTKLFSVIRQKAKNWKKVFIIASKSQIQGQELESLLPENGGADNIEIIQMPYKIGMD
jgi:hypothetical protein